MKGVTDLFLAKDRMAVFWFLVSCITIACCAIYVKAIMADSHKQSRVVIMDDAGVYYITPSLEFQDAKALHTAQTRLAMETLFNRGPKQLDNLSRVGELFTSESAKSVMEAFFPQEQKLFDERQYHQKVEIQSIVLTRTVGNLVAVTSVKGQLIRTGVFDGNPEDSTWDVEVNFGWVVNSTMYPSGGFPTKVYSFKVIKQTKTSST